MRLGNTLILLKNITDPCHPTGKEKYLKLVQLYGYLSTGDAEMYGTYTVNNSHSNTWRSSLTRHFWGVLPRSWIHGQGVECPYFPVNTNTNITRWKHLHHTPYLTKRLGRGRERERERERESSSTDSKHTLLTSAMSSTQPPWPSCRSCTMAMSSRIFTTSPVLYWGT